MIKGTAQTATDKNVQFVGVSEVASLRFPILVLGSFYLVSRLLILNFNEAEFSDGYSYLNWFAGKAAIWHPAYPWLATKVAKVVEPIIAGRLVSIFAGLLCIPSLMIMAREVHGRDAAIFAGSLFIVAPLVIWTNSRVLSESLFLAFTLPAVLYFYRASKDISCFPFFALFSGFAILTRPEGLIFLPPLLILFVVILYNRKNDLLIKSIPASIPWVLFIFWMASSPAHGYQSVANDNLQFFSLKNSAVSIWRYLIFYPYAMSLPIFALAFAGFRISRLHSSDGSRKRWLQILFYLLGVWFIALGTHWAWTTRLLIVPCTLMLVEAGGTLSRLRSMLSKTLWSFVFVGTLFFSGVFSLTALYLQKETFQDIKETAQWLKYHHQGVRVVSDESLKVKYYLGYYPVNYESNEKRASNAFSMQDRGIRPNDVLLLHSFYTPLAPEIRSLTKRYELKFLNTRMAQTRPILGGGLLETDHATNHPASLMDHFFLQKHQSVALQVLRLKREHSMDLHSVAERGFSAIELLRSLDVAKSERQDLLRVYLFQYFPRDVSVLDQELLEREIARSKGITETKPENFKIGMLYFFLSLVKTNLLNNETDAATFASTVENWKQAERYFYEAGETGKELSVKIHRVLADADASGNGKLEAEEMLAIFRDRGFDFKH